MIFLEEEVAALVNNELRQSGLQSITFDGKDLSSEFIIIKSQQEIFQM